MKKFKNLSVKVKVPIMLGIVSLLVFALICVMLVIPLRSTTFRNATSIARLSAVDGAATIAAEINGTTNVLRAFSGIVTQIAESRTIPNDQKRQLLLEQLMALESGNQIMTNVWCIIEPNALDGLDSMFINRTGSNHNGVFSPWIAGGQLASVDHMLTTDSWRVPRATGREFISEPYEDDFEGRRILIFSISVPVFANGAFIGIVACDFHIDDLNAAIQSLNLGMLLRLITDRGINVIHYDQSRIGQIAEGGNREILDKLSTGRLFEGFYEYEGRMQYKVFVPVDFSPDTNPWFFAVDVPNEHIYANSRRITNYLAIYFALAVLLIALGSLFVVRPLIKSISNVTEMIRKLSLGQLSINIANEQSLDELGTMQKELKHLVEGLKDTAAFAHAIGDGNFNAEYNKLSDGDALGSALIDMRKSLQTAADEQNVRAVEENQRNWGTAGLAKFAEILRSDNTNMEALAYNVISNMVKYIGANQGGIFVMNDSENENEKYLEMKACYAFDRKKYDEKQIQPGEGLVGTCYLEGESIYMTDVPDEYINITSGLGDANPKAVLICPLKVNDEIYGVIELAAFEPFEPYKLDFVQKVSESIASTISTVRINIRTERLLAQTRLQAEEMANAEEELRQNMEEMQATQEESRRREIELNEILAQMQETQTAIEESKHSMQQFHDGIFATDNVVEFSSAGVVIGVNQNLCDLFQLDKSVFIGKHLSVFMGEEECNKAMRSMANGKIFENMQQINASGKVLNIKQKFMPICSKEGVLQSGMLLAFHDQEQELRQNMEEMRAQEEQLHQNLEEMKTQDEQVRQSMEELQVTLEESSRKDFEIGQFYNAIFTTDNMIELSSDLHIKDANNNLLNLFGWKKSDVLDKHLSDFVGKENSDKVQEAANKGAIYEDEVTVRGHKLLQKFVPIRDKSNKLLRVLLLVTPDNTDELRLMKEALQEENRVQHDEIKTQLSKMHMTMIAADIALWDMMVVKGDPVNPNNTFIWTKEFRNLLGYSNEAEFPNVLNSWSDKLHPEDKEKTLNAFASHIIDRTGKTPFDVEYRLLKKNGEYGWFKAFGETTRDADGYAISVAGGIREITKEKEQILKLHMTMIAADIALWDMMVVKGDPVNPNNTFVWTEEFRNLLGYSSVAEFPNVLNSWSDKLHPEDKERTLNAFAAHIIDRTGKTPFDIEYRLQKKSGEYGYFRAFGETTRDSEGYAIRVAGGIQEITK